MEEIPLLAVAHCLCLNLCEIQLYCCDPSVNIKYFICGVKIDVWLRETWSVILINICSRQMKGNWVIVKWQRCARGNDLAELSDWGVVFKLGNDGMSASEIRRVSSNAQKQEARWSKNQRDVRSIWAWRLDVDFWLCPSVFWMVHLPVSCSLVWKAKQVSQRGAAYLWDLLTVCVPLISLSLLQLCPL